MKSIRSNIKMEFVNLMDTTASGAFWSPAFEADSFNSFVTESQGQDVSPPAFNRRKLATELLESLERQEAHEQQDDEPYCGWLEEPMDLEVFGQSLAIEPISTPLDEDDENLSAPPSPLISHPQTPINPTSPQELYPVQEDFPPVKFDESPVIIPADSEELLESLEQMLQQIQAEQQANSPAETFAAETVQDVDEDLTSALLDSLIEAYVEENQVLNELADFNLLLMDASDVERESVVNKSSITNPCDSISGNSSSSSDSDDIEWAPSVSSVRNSRTATSTSKSVTQRKPRKKSLKTEDRRLRKKEQNKTAATRYRIKKKVELEILLEEEAVLEQHNRKLQKRHDDLANEVRYLKKLMRELFTTRSVKRL